MDLHQLWTIVSVPDNVPIVLLLFVVPFYTWYGLRQAFANDRLITQLEADPAMAKTHHRKVQPWKPGWAKEVHVWPFLLRIEFLAAIIVTVILMVWSITLNAPLEEPSNPTLTMNPSKAPWYFLGLQEMLVYFDPWMAGVIFPVAHYRGADGDSLHRRESAGQRLLHLQAAQVRHPDVHLRLHRAVGFDDRDRHVDSRAGLDVVLARHDVGSQPPGSSWSTAICPISSESRARVAKTIFGAVVMGGYVAVSGWILHKVIAGSKLVVAGKALIKENAFRKKIYSRMSLLQYVTMQAMMILMVMLPIKILIRLLFRIKYVWVTPWFNI